MSLYPPTQIPYNPQLPEDDGDEDGAAPVISAEEVVEHRFVHPEAVGFFEKAPWVRHFPVLGMAIEGFGPTFIASIGAAYILCKGIANMIIKFSRQPMLVNRYGLDGTRYQRLASLANMGWSVKAFIAVITDTFALFGYTKRWYMFLSCAGGAAFALAYGLLPAKESSGNPAAAFIFLTSLGMANIDILSEGHFSRLIRNNPKSGPAMVSWMWWMINVGYIIASVIQGPLSDSNLMQVGVFVSAGLQAVTAVIFLFNWYGERPNRVERAEDARMLYQDMLKAQAEARADDFDADRLVGTTGLPGKKNSAPEAEDAEGEAHTVAGGVPRTGSAGAPDSREVQQSQQQLAEGLTYDAEDRPSACGNGRISSLAVSATPQPGIDFAEPAITTLLWGAVEVNKEVVTRNWKLVLYSCIMSCSVVTLAVVTILGTTWHLLYAAIAISVVCCACAFYALPRVIAKANLFVYSYAVFYLQIPGALDTFYMAKPDCLPDGPHFTYTFYNTISAIIGNIGGIVGVAMFTYLFSKHSYPMTMCVTTTIQIIASLFDLVIVKRWNIAIGIPDHALYICGDAIVYEVCHMLSFMPTVMLMSRLCPRGSESMVYALMAGFGNLGISMSNAIGSLIMELAWPVNTKAGSCDFSNVPWLVITGHLALPMLIIPLAFLLLPHARICDDIDVNGRVINKRRVQAQRAAAEAQQHANDSMGPQEPFYASTAEPEQPQRTVPTVSVRQTHTS